MYLVILKLEKNKYYITMSNTFIYNLQNFNEKNNFIKIYRPVSIEKCIIFNNLKEDDVVYSYMQKYGIENVRGGSFKEVFLNNEDLDLINLNLNNNFFLNLSSDDEYHSYSEEEDDEEDYSELDEY